MTRFQPNTIEHSSGESNLGQCHSRRRRQILGRKKYGPRGPDQGMCVTWVIQWVVVCMRTVLEFPSGIGNNCYSTLCVRKANWLFSHELASIAISLHWVHCSHTLIYEPAYKYTHTDKRVNTHKPCLKWSWKRWWFDVPALMRCDGNSICNRNSVKYLKCSGIQYN